MLIRQEVLDGVRAGTISLAFRRWRRPTVRTGGTLLTGAGQLSIGSVAPITASDITEADAKLAGYPDRAALLADLDSRPEGEIYRIELLGLRPDPRVALRETLPDDAELAELAGKLAAMDERSPEEPWTRRALDLIAENPGVLAAKLARQMGFETPRFKANIRKAQGARPHGKPRDRLSPFPLRNGAQKPPGSPPLTPRPLDSSTFRLLDFSTSRPQSCHRRYIGPSAGPASQAHQEDEAVVMGSNAAIVKAIYEAMARGDVPAVLGAFDPEIEWYEAEGNPLEDGNPYRGGGAVASGVFKRLIDRVDRFSATPANVIDGGDTVVVEGRYRGQVKGSDRQVDSQFAHVWHLRNGKVVRFQQYTDTKQWAEIFR